MKILVDRAANIGRKIRSKMCGKYTKIPDIGYFYDPSQISTNFMTSIKANRSHKVHPKINSDFSLLRHKLWLSGQEGNVRSVVHFSDELRIIVETPSKTGSVFSSIC